MSYLFVKCVYPQKCWFRIMNLILLRKIKIHFEFFSGQYLISNSKYVLFMKQVNNHILLIPCKVSDYFELCFGENSLSGNISKEEWTMIRKVAVNRFSWNFRGQVTQPTWDALKIMNLTWNTIVQLKNKRH